MIYLFDLFVPIFMIIIGVLTKVKPIKEINSMIGYRTKLSMRSQKNWEVGQKLMGEVWIKSGIFLLLITVIFAFIVEKNSYDKVLHGYFMMFQTFYLLLTIPIIELLLKKEVGKK